jgi:2-(1,2-epoxy-1,2-dihydrophenyl)acetyl-CoA isomerase
MSEDILYRVDDGVALITLNRPAHLNALAGDMRRMLLDRLHAAEADTAVGCVVITGAGRAFCAGGNVKGMAALQAADDVQEIDRRMRVAGDLVCLLRRMHTPVIAAVNGVAAGAGMNIALACDLRHAASHAEFAQSFVRIGLIPDWGGHYLLTRLVGPARAREIMWSGEGMSAAEAYRVGLLNEVFEAEQFEAAVCARAASGAGSTSRTGRDQTRH